MPPRRIPTKPAAPKEGTVKEISKEGAELEKLENKVGHQVGRQVGWLERSKYPIITCISVAEGFHENLQCIDPQNIVFVKIDNVLQANIKRLLQFF